MATQTVKYNPQTGKALTKGQSVVVNGKTYTEGSTNIGGSASSKATTKSTSTLAPVKKVSSVPNKSSGGFVSAKNIPTGDGTSYNKYGSSKPKPVGDSISTTPKKKGFLNKVGGFINDAIDTGKELLGGKGASAYSGYTNNPYTYNNGLIEDAPKAPKPFEGAVSEVKSFVDSKTYKSPKIIPSTKKTYDANTNNSQTMNLDISAPANTTNSQNMDLSLGLGLDRPLSGNMVKDSGVTPIKSGSSYTPTPKEVIPSKQTEQRKTIDPLTGEEIITTTESQPLIPEIKPNTTATANITGLTDTLTSSVNQRNPWDKNQAGEFQDNKIVNYQSSAASLFNSPQEVDNSFNTDSVFNANIKKAAQATGKSEMDILNGIKAKVQSPTNGVLPPQSTSQYLDLINTTKSPANIKAEADLLNKETVMTSQFNTQQEKLAYDILEQTKKDSQAMIDNLARRELSRETTLREKAQFMIDKARAEFDMKDAEVAQSAISAETNLKEFLAHIGALNTDGNSQVGIENLKQRYQAQRQALRSNFELASREIQMNMNSDINEMESKLDEDTLKINMDLSKSEREVALDVLKLRNNTNKQILEAQSKYATALRQERDKQSTKASSYASQYSDSLWKLMSTGNIPESVARGMINYKGDINPTTKNVDIVKQYTKTKQPETEPKYTGEKLKTFTPKTTQKFLDSGLVDQMDIQKVATELSNGWSLQQIAKNSNMPTVLYNLFKEQLDIPS